MKVFKVYVGDKEESNNLEEDVKNLGVRSVRAIREFTLYWLAGLTEKELSLIAKKALHDPFTQTYHVNKIPLPITRGATKVEIISHLGVIDPRESSVKKAASDLGVKNNVKVKFGRLYLIYGRISSRNLNLLKSRFLMKPVIEHEVKRFEQPFVRPPKYKFKLVVVPIRGVLDKKLLEISERGGLSLSLEEMKAIQKYFEKLGRDPTDVELETLAQTWSEHCSHKTLKGNVVHNGKRIHNLLRSTIIGPSQKLNKKYVVSAFSDNAGGIKIGDKVVCLKVETHNHPSALEPVGGSETGTGGVIRDILGFGKGAKPISSIVCFGVGPQNRNYNKLPKGVLHPKSLLSGIVQGTKSYGNQMGIPTDFFQDSLVVHQNYIGNPLVYCGTIGVTDANSAKKTQPKKEDLVVLLGGLTGRDGIHGATFSSTGLQEKSESISGGAVQIGDAIMEKKALDALLEIKDKNLISWVTDCGGGGLSSAVGETGESVGAIVDLEKVPKKYEGLSYTEIWISESQERMVLVTTQKNKSEILRVCKKHNVPCTVIGRFTGDNKLRLSYQGRMVADLDMQFLHKGCPKSEKVSVWKKQTRSNPKKPKLDLSKALLRLLKDPNICSKSTLAHQYDSSVQGRTFVGPLIGGGEYVHSDVTVRQISPNSYLGVALSIAINPHITTLNPRRMSRWIISQSLAKLAASGADVSKAALLDNFSWGNPSKQEVLGELVESLLGCRESVEGFKIPFISGKDSLNNEYKEANKEISIPGTLLLTAVAPIRDVRGAVNYGFNSEGSLVFYIGFPDGSMGGSYFNKLCKYMGGEPPKIDFERANGLFKRFLKASDSRLIKSAAAIGKGGLGVTLAKMCLASSLGASVDITLIKNKTEMKDYQILFSESDTGFVIEAEKSKTKKLKAIFGDYLFKIGAVSEKNLSVTSSKEIIDVSINTLAKSYLRHFS